MRRLALLTVVLLVVPLYAAAGGSATCHQAAFVGPMELGFDRVGASSLAASGDLVLADGRVLTDGTALTPGQRVLQGAVRNVGSRTVLLTLADGDRVQLGPNKTVAFATAVEVENERICVCECDCGFDTVQIRCDSSAMDCSTLDGTTCVDDDGDERELDNCTKKYVKPTPATPQTP